LWRAKSQKRKSERESESIVHQPVGDLASAAAQAFRGWIKQEIAALDWRGLKTKLIMQA
jgi:hypothetical protein